jgi:tetratricopeptide (TPR) repeat protein
MIPSLLAIFAFTISQADSYEILIQKGLEHSFNEEYVEAKGCFDEALRLDPESPLGYFVYAGLYRIYASDFVTDSLLDSFFVYAERTSKRAKKMLERNRKSAWAYYFLGGINMYISSVYIERGNYLRALGYAEQSMDDITICLQIDEELYDAYLVVGSYEYLKGSFPLWGAYKDKGIEKIRTAAEKSRYARPIAKNILSLMLLREERNEEAIKEAEELSAGYPESRTFLWTLSKAYLQNGDWTKAIKSYEELLDNIFEEQPENIYNIVQAKLALATCFLQVDNTGKATEFSKDVIELGEKDRSMEQMVKEARAILKESQPK